MFLCCLFWQIRTSGCGILLTAFAQVNYIAVTVSGAPTTRCRSALQITTRAMHMEVGLMVRR